MIQDVAIATEGSFAQVDATTKLPTLTGLTFYGLPAKRANWLEGKVETRAVRDLVRIGAYRHRDEAISIVNRTGSAAWGAENGEKIQRWTGPLVLDFLLEGIGAGGNFATYPDLPLIKLLRTAMDEDAPANANDVVASAGDENTFTATNVARFPVGRGIAAVIAGAVEHAVVTGFSGSVVSYHPATSAAIALAARVRLAYTLFPKLGSSLPTVCLRFNSDGRVHYAFGCRVSKLELTEQEGAITARVTVEPAVILRLDGAAHAEWTEPGGHAVTVDGSHQVFSDSVRGVSAPATGTRSALSLKGWDATITWTLAAVGGGREGIVGRSQTKITDCQIEASIRGEANSTLAAMLRKSEERTLMLGCGPGGAGSGQDAQGMALAILAAHPTSTVDAEEEDMIQERITFGGGRWTGDNATDHAAGSAWRLLFPL